MPSRVDEPKNGSRFELPALNLNFGSITDGTDIPPPPDSPLEKPAEKPAKTDAPAKSNGQAPVAVAPEVKPSANGNQAGTKRPADDVPPSPVSTRQGSLRRLLSRTMLNNSYAEGEQASSQANGVAVNASRPPSRDAYSLMDERKSKRSSGWFKRLRGGDTASRRSSLMIDTQKQPITTTTTAIPTPRGPPPPMIPELKELEKDESSFGNDLFKNIK